MEDPLRPLWSEAPQNKEYYNLLLVPLDCISFFRQKAIFWIPVVTSGSNFIKN